MEERRFVPFLFFREVAKGRCPQVVNPESMLDKGRELLEPLRNIIILSSALAVGGNNGWEKMLGLHTLWSATEKEKEITKNLISPAKIVLGLDVLSMGVERAVRKKAREFVEILGLPEWFGEGTINWHIAFSKKIQEKERAKLEQRNSDEITIFLLKKNPEAA